MFLSQLFNYFYKLEVLNGQKLRSFYLWILKVKVGLEVRLRRKVQLLPRPTELLFMGLFSNVVIGSSFPLSQHLPHRQHGVTATCSSESWKLLNVFYETFK